MMKPLLTLAVVLAAAGMLAADDAANDLKKFVGTWEEVSNTSDGKKRADDEVKGSRVVIDASGKWEYSKDGTVMLRGSVKLDPSKSPRAADWSVEGLEKPALGIYEIDGDTWKHCFHFEKRPTEFASKEGSGVTYIVMKRVKK